MNRLVDIALYAFIVAGIFVLTAPNSKGPRLVGAIGDALASLVYAATGSGALGGKQPASRVP